MNWCVLLRTSDLQHCTQSFVYFAYFVDLSAAADHTDGLDWITGAIVSVCISHKTVSSYQESR